jgi:hypothetical protein
MNATNIAINLPKPTGANPPAQVNVCLHPNSTVEIKSGNSTIEICNDRINPQPANSSSIQTFNSGGNNVPTSNSRMAAPPAQSVDPVQHAIEAKKNKFGFFMSGLESDSKNLKNNVKAGMQGWNQLFAGYGLNAQDFGEDKNTDKDFFSKQEKFLVPDAKDFQEMKVRMLSGKTGEPEVFDKAFSQVNKNKPDKDPFRKVENTQNNIKEKLSTINELLNNESFEGVSLAELGVELKPEDKAKLEKTETDLEAELKKFEEILPENGDKPLNKLESDTGVALIINKINKNPNYINDELIEPRMQALKDELDMTKREEIISVFKEKLNTLLDQTKAYTKGLTQKDIEDIKKTNPDLEKINSAFLFNKLKQTQNIALLGIGSGMGNQVLKLFKPNLFTSSTPRQNSSKITIPFKIGKRPADQLTSNNEPYQILTKHFENVFNGKADLGQGIDETINKLMQNPEQSNWPKVKSNNQVKTNSDGLNLPNSPENNLADIYNSTANIFNANTQPETKNDEPTGTLKIGFSPFIGIKPLTKNENENKNNIEEVKNQQLELENILMQNNISKQANPSPEAIQKQLNNSRLSFLYNSYLQSTLQNPPDKNNI